MTIDPLILGTVQEIVAGVPSEMLPKELCGDSRVKAVLLRGKILDLITEKNKDFFDKVKDLESIRQEFAKKLTERVSELKALKGENTEEAIKEIEQEVHKGMIERVTEKAYSFVFALVENSLVQQNGENAKYFTPIYFNDEKLPPVEIEFTEEQLTFIKALVEKHGMEVITPKVGFPFEYLVMQVCKAIGIE